MDDAWCPVDVDFGEQIEESAPYHPYDDRRDLKGDGEWGKFNRERIEPDRVELTNDWIEIDHQRNERQGQPVSFDFWDGPVFDLEACR